LFGSENGPKFKRIAGMRKRRESSVSLLLGGT